MLLAARMARPANKRSAPPARVSSFCQSTSYNCVIDSSLPWIGESFKLYALSFCPILRRPRKKGPGEHFRHGGVVWWSREHGRPPPRCRHTILAAVYERTDGALLPRPNATVVTIEPNQIERGLFYRLCLIRFLLLVGEWPTSFLRRGTRFIVFQQELRSKGTISPAVDTSVSGSDLCISRLIGGFWP